MPPPLLDALVAARPTAPPCWWWSRRWACSTASTAAGPQRGTPPTWPPGSGCPCCWCWTCRARRRPPPPSPAASRCIDPAVRVGGVVLNRVGSARHRAGGRALAALGLPVLGAIPRDAALALPERHLGLVQAPSTPAWPAMLDRLADMAERALDLRRHRCGWPARCQLAACAVRPRRRRASGSPSRRTPPSPSPTRICWPAGATRARRSCRSRRWPTNRRPPTRRLLAAGRLSGAACRRAGGRGAASSRGLQRFAATRPGARRMRRLHGARRGADRRGGGRHAHGRAAEPRDQLRPARAAPRLPRRRRCPTPRCVRGHEFHYATLSEPGTDAPYAVLRDAAGTSLGPAGGRRGRVTGSFFHAIAREGP